MPTRNHAALVKQHLQKLNRMVVKVGTHLLRGDRSGLNLEVIESLCAQIAAIRKKGVEVILVSSGAVGAGAEAMKLERPPDEVCSRQALAAIGQSRLMQIYEEKFSLHRMKVAQVLLTRDGLDHRQRYLNARNTLETLLKWEVLPVINENDTVSIEELKFGDNDQLSAMIAGKLGADLLVILTDVGGVYDRPPKEEGARRIPYVSRISEINVLTGTQAGSAFGLGGMRSKLEAAQLATRAGVLTFIGDGHEKDILLRVISGEMAGTWFEPRKSKLSSRKRWIAFGKRLCGGRITVDGGAARALREQGKSLLPSGVVAVEGRFSRGDLVQVCVEGSRLEIARGLVQYSAEELQEAKRKRTQEIKSLLGARSNYEVIHRDDLVILTEGGEG